jgi:hypothetical protein
MAFEKNHQLSKGRPKGSKGKANQQIKDAFKLLIENNLESLQKDLDSLESKDRLKMIIDLSSFVVPKMRSVEANVETTNFINDFNIRELYNSDE